ncbi:MAG TPA: hypothetical protein PKE00_01445 [Planctomycetota bacterium]|nr:hypothetical protein [Planctomycetota bacterium]
MTIHGFARTTEDIDVLIQRSDQEEALRILESLGFSHDAGSIPLRQGTPTETLIRRVSKIAGAELLTVDLILVYPAYESIWNTAVRVALGDREIVVVSIEGLAAMKRMSGRPRDLLDLQQLGLTDDPPADS